MMQIKIGDKVRFLNDIGGGIIVGFNGDNEVVVEQESGFCFPHPRHECVVVADDKPQPSTQQVVSRAQGVAEVQCLTSPTQNRSSERYNISLAFTPQDLDNLGSSSIKIYLINDSEYRVFFTISTKQDRDKELYKLLKSSTIRPNEILLIDEIPHRNIGQLESLALQIIAHKEIGTFQLQEPICCKLTTRLVKFSKPSSFVHSPILGCNAMITNLITLESNSKVAVDSTKQLIDKFTEPSLTPTIKSSIKQRRDNPATPETVEVDLHIDKLLDSTAGMESGDILEYQMEHFRSTISQYSRYRGLKLIFIHGKGDGVLRRSILNELKRTGRANRCQEASFKRYGYGALMVIM
ncbi:MAG: DUF2027 domain-containing protein [Rikenellaceae bacterium]